MVTPRGRRQHWSNLLKAFSMKGDWACLSPHFLSISQSWIVQIKSNQLQVSSEEWEESRGGRRDAADVFERAPDVIRIIRLAWLLRKQRRHERRGLLYPQFQCPRIMKKPPRGGGGRRGRRDSRSPILIASSRYNLDEEKSGLVDSFGRCHVAKSYRRFGRSMSISLRFSAKFPANSISASRAKYSPRWLPRDSFFFI